MNWDGAVLSALAAEVKLLLHEVDVLPAEHSKLVHPGGGEDQEVGLDAVAGAAGGIEKASHLLAVERETAAGVDLRGRHADCRIPVRQLAEVRPLPEPAKRGEVALPSAWGKCACVADVVSRGEPPDPLLLRDPVAARLVLQVVHEGEHVGSAHIQERPVEEDRELLESGPELVLRGRDAVMAGAETGDELVVRE